MANFPGLSGREVPVLAYTSLPEAENGRSGRFRPILGLS